MNINRIAIGSPDAPLLEFYNDSIVEIAEDTSVSMVGAELSVDRLLPVTKYNLIIRQVIVPKDIDLYQGIRSADGYLLCGKYNYDIRAIPYGTPVRLFINNRPAGLYYLNKVERLNKETFKLNCFSAVGLMDKQMHIGGIYSGERFDYVLAEILGNGFEYIVDPDVAALQVFGWLPYGSKRSNLHQLLIAYGVTITKSDTGGMLFTFLNAIDYAEISSNRIYVEGSVEYGEEASRVELLEHGFYYLSSAAEETLLDTRGDRLENSVVVFQQPIFKESIRVTEDSDLQLHEVGTNYAVVSGAGVLVGKPYVRTTKLLVATNEDAPIEKTVAVNKATLITMANSENCLKRISEYYFNATRVKASVVVETEKPGKRYVFQNPFEEKISAFLSNMSSNFSGITKAECEFIQDYVPVAQGQSFGKRDILELTDKEQIWEVPESVYKKDVPQIRVVLIGEGYDGEDGKNGEAGNRARNDQGGLGGKGGSGGKAGKGGKILSATIDCSNLAFLRYGKSGKNSWLYAGQDYFNSGNGTSSATGFVELFTGAVFALPGTDGGTGGDGGEGGTYPPIAEYGTARPGVDGEAVEFEGVTYKGGNAGARKMITGTEYGITSYMHVYSAACGGGGAAAGAKGGEAITATPTYQGEGGDGANALAAEPTVELYGSGGNGGSGGGGGGGAGARHWWNSAYTTLIELDSQTPGAGGKGSVGTKGYRGCIIIYY